MTPHPDPLLYTLEEVLERPDPVWLIRHILPFPGLSLLYGPSGRGKSFVALDWALSVASGEAWLGHYPIDTPGAVIYIACEGTGGLKRRISAWLAHHPDVGSPEEISFCLHALDVYDVEERTRLLNELDRLYPVEPTIYMDPDTGEQDLEEYTTPLRLIVIDTVARVFQGDDENDNAQMGDFIAAIEEFATVHHAAVVAVHHSAKAKASNERGGGALRGAMDACWECKGEKREGKLVKIALVCNKMKDAEEITVGMEMIEYELPTLSLDEEGKVRKCGALGYMDLGVVERVEEDSTPANPSDILIDALTRAPEGLTSGEWWVPAITSMSRATFNRHRATLEKDGKIVKFMDRWYAV